MSVLVVQSWRQFPTQVAPPTGHIYWDWAPARATQGSLRSDKGILRDFTKPKIAPKQKTTVMEELTKEFDGKMQSLKFSLGKDEEVIGSKNTEAIARHRTLLMSKLQAVHIVKESIVERKFTEGESEEKVNTWMKEFDGFLKEADERA